MGTPLSYNNRNNILFIYFVFLDGGKRKSDQTGGGETSGEKSGGSGAGGFSNMVKKIKGRGAITAAGTMMQKLQKDKGGGAAGGKGKDGSKKGGLSSIMSTLKMAKKKCVEEDYDDEYDEEDEDDLATDEGTFINISWVGERR